MNVSGFPLEVITVDDGGVAAKTDDYQPTVCVLRRRQGTKEKMPRYRMRGGAVVPRAIFRRPGAW
jgi:hypothetical protein